MKPRHACNLRRRGWSLIQVLIAMPLFLVFMVLASKLFFAHMTTSRVAAEQSALGHRMDQALFRLRQDAWAASRADVAPDGATLTLATHGREVVWQLSDGQITRQTHADAQPLSYPIPGPLRFAPAVGAVVVEIEDLPISIPLAPPTIKPSPEASP